MSTTRQDSVPDAWQQTWLTALRAPQPAAVQRACAGWQGGRRTAEAGLAVYINNVRATLIRALEASFPATLALAGRAAFARAVLVCLRDAPPASGDLGDYGAALPAALAAELAAQARQAPHPGPTPPDAALCAELAQWEWLLDQLPRCPPDTAWTLTDAATLAPDAWAGLRLRLVRRARLFEATHPVRAWQHQALAAASPDSLPLPPEAVEPPVLVVAEGGDVRDTRSAGDACTLLPLTPAEAAWLRALGPSTTLADATADALALDPDFALQPLLLRLLQAGALARPGDLP